MVLYKYSALSEEGKKISGIIDADNFDLATLRLNRQKLLLLDLKEYSKKGRMLKTAVPLFTQELCRLLKAGLALYEALLILEEKYRGTKTHPLLLDILDSIKRGDKLSRAIEKEPAFSPLYRSMVANAEKTGNLVDCLEELSTLLTRQEKLKKQIISSLTYPTLLLGFCFFVLFSLLYYVIPSLAELFVGKDLHPMTRFVLGLSYFATSNKTEILLTVTIIFTVTSVSFFFQSAKRRVVQLLLSLPFIKNLFLHMSIVRFSRALSSLLKGGVSFVKAVSLSKEVLTHPKLKREILRAESQIAEGGKFSEILKKSTSFPPLFSRLLAIAEESGKMDTMLSQIAMIYEEDVEKTLNRLTSVLQPMLLILLGVIVGFVLLSVLLPLTDVNSFM